MPVYFLGIPQSYAGGFMFKKLTLLKLAKAIIKTSDENLRFVLKIEKIITYSYYV